MTGQITGSWQGQNRGPFIQDEKRVTDCKIFTADKRLKLKLSTALDDIPINMSIRPQLPGGGRLGIVFVIKIKLTITDIILEGNPRQYNG